MKLKFIFVSFTLSVIVNGAWWAVAVQPVILSLGAILASIDLDLFNVQLPFINKQDFINSKDASELDGTLDDEKLLEEFFKKPMTDKEYEESLKKEIDKLTPDEVRWLPKKKEKEPETKEESLENRKKDIEYEKELTPEEQ